MSVISAETAVRPRELVARIDGGSRGNPGPAAFAAVMETPDGKVLDELSGYLRHATNNVAEYRGLLLALDYAIANNYRCLRVLSDSELLVRQINGEYKVKSSGLKPLFERARALISSLDAFSIRHVYREENRAADRLANQTLDAAGRAASGGSQGEA
jgi:ribonuclease HI